MTCYHEILLRGYAMARKLAAIVVADVVNYSALMGVDEVAALTGLNRHFDELITPKARQYHGRVFKRTGDGILLEFQSAVEAVAFATQVQCAMRVRNAEISDDKRIEFRIGVNIGDVIEEAGDIYGDGVNIAARLEGVAEPSGVCISGSVHNQVRGKLDLGFRHLGKICLKNISEPVDAYHVVLDARAEALTAPEISTKSRKSESLVWATAIAAVISLVLVGGITWWAMKPRTRTAVMLSDAAETSIAVIPYASISDTKEERLFAKGLTNDLRTALGSLPKLLVVAEASARKFADKDADARTISTALNARYILRGSVEKSGDRLRVSAQLADGKTGAHRWTEQYNLKATDIFEIRDEIVKKVLTGIFARLKYGDTARVLGSGTRNLEAWLLAIRGWEEVVTLNRDNNFRARDLFRRAHEADPKWSRPLAFLAWTYREEARRGWSASKDATIKKAIELSKKAISLDPQDPGGYSSLGALYVQTGKFKEGIALKEKALGLAPNYINAIVGLAWSLQWVGELNRALALYERAKRISPDLPATYIAAEAFARHQAGQTETAIKLYTMSLKKLDRFWTRPFLAAAYADLDRMEEAKAQVQLILKAKPDARVSTFMSIIKFKDPKRVEWIRDLFKKAGLPE